MVQLSKDAISTYKGNNAMTSREMKLSEAIIDLANAGGIDALGFAEASCFDGYLLEKSRRRDPGNALPDAATIIVAGIYIGGMVLPSWDKPDFGRTSRLFLSGFFLDVVEPLEPLAAHLEKEGHRAVICDGRAPGGSIVPLKLAAIRAGLGWQGKHSLFISKKFGTFLALGGIITSAKLKTAKNQEKDHCKTCRLCQDACPLGALERPHVLEVGKCLSNLLQSENMPPAATSVQGNRVADCEICQNACPWNQKHIKKPLQTQRTVSFHKKIDPWGKFFQLEKLAGLSEKAYEETLRGLDTQIPYSLFRRNVYQAITNGNIG
jgi:epoxyqueuosine reductase